MKAAVATGAVALVAHLTAAAVGVPIVSQTNVAVVEPWVRASISREAFLQVGSRREMKILMANMTMERALQVIPSGPTELMTLISQQIVGGNKISLHHLNSSAFFQLRATRREVRMNSAVAKAKATQGTAASMMSADQARKLLNNMAEEAEKKLDMEKVKCSETCEKQHAMTEEARRDIGEYNSQGAASRARILGIQTSLAGAEDKLPRLSEALAANDGKCRADAEALKVCGLKRVSERSPASFTSGHGPDSVSMSHKVQLAVSALGGVPGATAYHSSVLVDGEEFSFSAGGISRAAGPASHRQAPGKPRILEMGTSAQSGVQLMAVLGPHFEPGTYDLLRKNCNSFSDCALYYLVKQRISNEYRALERFGGQMPALLRAVSQGTYQPNASAEAFDHEGLIRNLDPEKQWKTPGHATGGTTVDSAEAMRAIRLARLNGRSIIHEVPSEAATSGIPAPPLPPPEVPPTSASRASPEILNLPAQGSNLPPSQPHHTAAEAHVQPPAADLDTSADAELARVLQEEEGVWVHGGSQEALTDEELARHLQAEEDARRRRAPAAPLEEAAVAFTGLVGGFLNNVGAQRGRAQNTSGARTPAQGLQGFVDSLAGPAAQFNEQLQRAFGGSRPASAQTGHRSTAF